MMKTDDFIITIKSVIVDILAIDRYIDIIGGVDEVVNPNDLYIYINTILLDKNNYINIQSFLAVLMSNIIITQDKYYNSIATADMADDENVLYDVEIYEDEYLVCLANLIRFVQAKINTIGNAVQKTKNNIASNNIDDFNVFDQLQNNIIEIIISIYPKWYDLNADRKIYDHFIVKHYLEINEINYASTIILTKEQTKEVYYELRNSRDKKAVAVEDDHIIDEDEGTAGDKTTGINTIKKIEQEMDRDYFYENLPWLERQSLFYLFRGGEIPEILKTFSFDGLRMIQRRIIIRSLAHFKETYAD